MLKETLTLVNVETRPVNKGHNTVLKLISQLPFSWKFRNQIYFNKATVNAGIYFKNFQKIRRIFHFFNKKKLREISENLCVFMKCLLYRVVIRLNSSLYVFYKKKQCGLIHFTFPIPIRPTGIDRETIEDTAARFYLSVFYCVKCDVAMALRSHFLIRSISITTQLIAKKNTFLE